MLASFPAVPRVQAWRDWPSWEILLNPLFPSPASPQPVFPLSAKALQLAARGGTPITMEFLISLIALLEDYTAFHDSIGSSTAFSPSFFSRFPLHLPGLHNSISLLIIRFVNHLVDFHQRHYYASSLLELSQSSSLQLPIELIHYRHSATHQVLPTKEFAEESLQLMGKWIFQYYIEEQRKIIEANKQMYRNSIENFKKFHKMRKIKEGKNARAAAGEENPVDPSISHCSPHIVLDPWLRSPSAVSEILIPALLSPQEKILLSLPPEEKFPFSDSSCSVYCHSIMDYHCSGWLFALSSHFSWFFYEFLRQLFSALLKALAAQGKSFNEEQWLVGISMQWYEKFIDRLSEEEKHWVFYGFQRELEDFPREFRHAVEKARFYRKFFLGLHGNQENMEIEKNQSNIEEIHQFIKQSEEKVSPLPSTGNGFSRCSQDEWDLIAWEISPACVGSALPIGAWDFEKTEKNRLANKRQRNEQEVEENMVEMEGNRKKIRNESFSSGNSLPHENPSDDEEWNDLVQLPRLLENHSESSMDNAESSIPSSIPSTIPSLNISHFSSQLERF